ncbi:MAG TPA: acylphosphatase [Candidatus Krumholzibacterium sp.]|nr:acylphosphatase [Candidatus Krumholzibacterium sp.]
MRRIRIRVSGIVQGVGFRFFTRSAARRAGVGGFVRNLPDGSVEAEAQGEENELETFIKEIKKGPVSSRVTNVEIENVAPDDRRAGFEIRF